MSRPGVGLVGEEGQGPELGREQQSQDLLMGGPEAQSPGASTGLAPAQQGAPSERSPGQHQAGPRAPPERGGR